MKDNALIPERQEYPLLNDNQSDDESKIAEKRRLRRYEIQGVFVTEFNDTIRSEVKKIWYLEK